MLRILLSAGVLGIRSIQLVYPLFLLLQSIRHRRMYGRVPPLALPAEVPRLSVILSVRNDERTVSSTVESLLRQDYPDLEILLVNDRSTDRTGPILQEFAQANPGRVKLLTVHELPAGWMGKQHGVWLAEQEASGEWLLLTDADAVLDPSCCRRVMAFALEAGCDHVTMCPRFESPSYLARSIALFLAYLAVIWGRADRVNDPGNNKGRGNGFFNLIRRSVYHAIGTHEEFGFGPHEDFRLGDRVKLLGFTQHVFDGTDLLTVNYYPSLRATIRGFDKGYFASFRYSRRRLLNHQLLVWVLFVDPWLGVWRGRRLFRLLAHGALATQVCAFLFANRRVLKQAVMALPTLPVSALFLVYASLHSMITVRSRGGLYWRETFYSLEELGEAMVRAEQQLAIRMEAQSASRRG